MRETLDISDRTLVKFGTLGKHGMFLTHGTLGIFESLGAIGQLGTFEIH